MATTLADPSAFQASTVMSATNLAVDAATKTITRASGSWLTDGFSLGYFPTFVGFTNAGNNFSTFPITAITASALSFATATGLVTEASAAGRTCTSNGSIIEMAGRIEALLTAAGWVRTADTGQTLASAMTSSTAANQVRGYQIWRMADSLSSSYPVFIKWEIGSGSTATNVGFWLTIGTGSNGGGSITGILIARTADTAITQSTSAYFAGSGDTSRIIFYYGVTSNSLFLSIERTKDALGIDTGDGIFLVFHINTTVYFKLVRFSGTNPPNSTTWGVIAPSGSSWALGTTIGVSPVKFFDGQPTNPSTNILCYLNADIAAKSVVSSSLYGVNRNYFTLGSIGGLPGIGNNALTPMIRYE